MSSQPFDSYKNEGVEYDYILQASVKVDEFNDDSAMQLLSLLTNEDCLGIYFTQVALGRVYPKYEYLNGKLHFTFGISLIDAPEQVTSKELIEDINKFILSLNKNIEQTPKLKIKEGDINVDILSENKTILDSIDKKLVNESKITFTKGNNTQLLVLTGDGVVERYTNGVLNNTLPFSKLGVIRECKGLIADGYTLTLKNEATIDNNEPNVLDNPEQTKKDLQQDIKDVDEIQDLKDELEDKLDTLYEESTDETNSDNENYVLVIYTKIGNDFQPDVLVRDILNSSDGEVLSVADGLDDAKRFTKEYAENTAKTFTDEAMKNDDVQFIVKAVNIEDIPNLVGLNEHKLCNVKHQEFTINNKKFPDNEYTNTKLTTEQLNNINLEENLNLDQITWLQDNIGSLNEIKTGIKEFTECVSKINEPVISLTEYFNKIHNILKGE